MNEILSTSQTQAVPELFYKKKRLKINKKHQNLKFCNRSSEKATLTVTLCGMQCINLEKDGVKILGRHFSNNMKEKQEKNFGCHIAKTGMFLNYDECQYL